MMKRLLLALALVLSPAAASATTCPVAHTWVTGETMNATNLNANPVTFSNCFSNIDWHNIGTAGIFASQIIPVSVAQATFGGSLGYVFQPNNGSAVPLTINGTAGTQSVDLLDVFLSPSGTKAWWLNYQGQPSSSIVNMTPDGLSGFRFATSTSSPYTLTIFDLAASVGLLQLGDSVTGSGSLSLLRSGAAYVVGSSSYSSAGYTSTAAGTPTFTSNSTGTVAQFAFNAAGTSSGPIAVFQTGGVTKFTVSSSGTSSANATVSTLLTTGAASGSTFNAATTHTNYGRASFITKDGGTGATEWGSINFGNPGVLAGSIDWQESVTGSFAMRRNDTGNYVPVATGYSAGGISAPAYAAPGYTTAGAAQGINYHEVDGSGTSNGSGQLAVTLSGTPYSSSSSYQCQVTVTGSSPGYATYAAASGFAFTVYTWGSTGAALATASVVFACRGT